MALQQLSLMKLGKMSGINALEVYRIMGKSLTGIEVQYIASEEQRAEEKSEERQFKEALAEASKVFKSDEDTEEGRANDIKIFEKNFYLTNATELEKLKYFSNIVKSYWEIKYGGICSRGEAIVLIQYVIDLFQRRPKEDLLPLEGKNDELKRKEFYKQPYGMEDKTCVHRAIMRNDIEVLRLLIMEEQKLDAKDKTGFTPLHYATEEGIKKVLVFAIEKKKEREEHMKKVNTESKEK